MPVLQHCCCCATLAVGGVIIGWVNLVCALISIIGAAVGFSDLNKLKEALIEHNPQDKDTPELISSFGTLMLTIVLVIKVVGLIVSILLILGATKRKRLHILPHLIFEGIYIFFIGLVWIIILIGVFSASQLMPMFIFFTAFFAFNLYLWLCVLSLYQELREDETRQPPGTYLMRPPVQNLQMQQKPPSYAVQQNLL